MVYVIDVSDPGGAALASATPTKVPGLDGVARQPRLEQRAHRQLHRGLPLPVDDRHHEGLTVFDLADPTKPQYLGRLKVPGGGFTHDVQVDARHRVGHRRGRDVRLRRPA